MIKNTKLRENEMQWLTMKRNFAGCVDLDYWNRYSNLDSLESTILFVLGSSTKNRNRSLGKGYFMLCTHKTGLLGVYFS
jgi:hypothetical protein